MGMPASRFFTKYRLRMALSLISRLVGTFFTSSIIYYDPHDRALADREFQSKDVRWKAKAAVHRCGPIYDRSHGRAAFVSQRRSSPCPKPQPVLAGAGSFSSWCRAGPHLLAEGCEFSVGH